MIMVTDTLMHPRPKPSSQKTASPTQGKRTSTPRRIALQPRQAQSPNSSRQTAWMSASNLRAQAARRGRLAATTPIAVMATMTQTGAARTRRMTTLTRPMRAIGSAVLALVLVSLMAACSHDHSHEAGHGHDDHGNDHHAHGHGDADDGRPTVVITHFTGSSELFMEYPALVVGEESRFLAHFTRLADFAPVRDGVLDVELLQQGRLKARFRVRAPARDGLFTPVIQPREPGEYDLVLKLSGEDLNTTHALGKVDVYATIDAVPPAEDVPDSGVSYLKEQQWQGEFDLAQADVRAVQASVPASATITAPPDRFATLRAPSAGIVASTAEGFPSIGARVERGQQLATLRPLLSAGTDAATLNLALERAEANERLAQQDLARHRRLFASGAIAEHRVHEAENTLEVARAETRAARARVVQLANATSRAGIAIIAPISGRLVDLRITPGAVVEVDSMLAQIAGDSELWLRADVAEADAPRISRPDGAWFDLGDRRVRLDVGDNAHLIAVGGVIDDTRRTLPVILGFATSDVGLRINQRVAAHILTGEQVQAVTVPRSALIDDGGQPIVYVQRGGETFERRAVRTGLRDAEFVAITHGLAAGERVVSQGAYDVHLAAADPAEAGHGHAH
ncbi:hypothetical protein DEH80_13305 [Abyssibacter profundi]|uniref:CzcB-like C-terminal circularly permuted SH3-like domain-containing protein n=2 Tax=Abyssibacter profundi TaxID=2182787 RepID=A0A383XRE3_9GAMM|nr:hypothetical protein DEH80_13305 [Abyssibacter profundi]